MSGEEIKKILESEGIVLSELAKMLGYDSDQRLHSKLKSDDVKSGIIEDIAKVTNKNICLFYGDKSNTTTKENSTDIISVPANVWNVISSQAESLKAKDRQMDMVLESLKFKDEQTTEIIELLKEQLKKGRDAPTRLRAANLVVEEDE